ncbi:hypothetical protein EI94DRAFT_1732307 [Lactarius quietus]|nr:hypothetical protein EI94DRAFT_1732307 [Lactarius quietus]
MTTTEPSLSRVERLSLRMGIHYGTPLCEIDLASQRMGYFGLTVNRVSRVVNSAAGGQILPTANPLRELET